MQDITVVSYNKISEGKYGVSIDLSEEMPMMTSGVQLLVQKVVLFLLKTPGRDYFEPALGGGFLQLTKPQVYEDARDMVTSGIEQAIIAVESQIRSRQLGSSCPSNEKLKSLGLMAKNGIIFFENERAYIINMELKNEAGERAEFAVPIISEGTSNG